MSTTSTTSGASTQSLLSLLQNSSLHDTLINTFLTLQSSSIPKTQTRLSGLIHDVKNDQLTKTDSECVIGEQVFQQDNEEQIRQFQQLIDLLRNTQQAEARNERKLLKAQQKQANSVSKPAPSQHQMQWYTNLTNEANYWNLVGIQMHDAPLVQKSLALFKLRHQNLKHIRFIGKFFGLERNYFVIETDHDAQESLSEQELAYLAPYDARNGGSGAKYRVKFGTTEQPAELPGERSTTNHYRYWVCTSGESLTQSNWVRLPDVTPAQILTAKRIKKYLTGRLNAPVTSYPQFPGSEANYLRAQVARIVAATTIAPKGLYKLWSAPEADDEDDEAPKEPVVPPVSDLILASAVGGEEEEEEEEEGGLNTKTLQKPDAWVHLYPIILDVGRATEYKPPKVKTGDEDEDEEEEEEEDETNKVPRLRAIQSDEGLQLPDYLKPLEKPKKTGDEEEEEEEPEEEEEGEEGGLKKGQYASWSFQPFGELDESSAIVLAQSLRWPGAFAFAADKGKKSGTIYMGDGLKVEGDLNVFTPVIPEPIQQDASEPKQQEDPTVSNEKRVRDFGEAPLRDEEEGEGEGEEED